MLGSTKSHALISLTELQRRSCELNVKAAAYTGSEPYLQICNLIRAFLHQKGNRTAPRPLDLLLKPVVARRYLAMIEVASRRPTFHYVLIHTFLFIG